MLVNQIYDFLSVFFRFCWFPFTIFQGTLLLFHLFLFLSSLCFNLVLFSKLIVLGVLLRRFFLFIFNLL